MSEAKARLQSARHLQTELAILKAELAGSRDLLGAAEQKLEICKRHLKRRGLLGAAERECEDEGLEL